MAKKIKIVAPELLNDIVRRMASELQMPKDALESAIENMGKFRQGALDGISREVGKALNRVDFGRITNDILENYTLKVNAEIRLEPKKKAKKKRSIP
jgi:hypothetical protein